MTHDEILESLRAIGAPPQLVLAIGDVCRDAAKMARRRSYDTTYYASGRKRTKPDGNVRKHQKDLLNQTVRPETSGPPRNIKPPSKNISIPENWTLDERCRAFARSKGWSEERIETEGERFKNYYLANGARRRDWYRAWVSWVLSPIQQQYQNGKANPNLFDAAAARARASERDKRIAEQMALRAETERAQARKANGRHRTT